MCIVLFIVLSRWNQSFQLRRRHFYNKNSRPFGQNDSKQYYSTLSQNLAQNLYLDPTEQEIWYILQTGMLFATILPQTNTRANYGSVVRYQTK